MRRSGLSEHNSDASSNQAPTTANRIPAKRRRESLPHMKFPPASTTNFIDDQLFKSTGLLTDIDYDSMLHSSYTHPSYEIASANQTIDDVQQFSFVGENSFIFRTPQKGANDQLNEVNKDVAYCINDILDSALTIKENIEDFKVEERLGELAISSNAAEMDQISDDFAFMENADMLDSLIPTFNAIDDSILITQEDNLPFDEQAFKLNYAFPKDFADVDTAALTFDGISSKKSTFNEARFDTSHILESAIRPSTKSFVPIDETKRRNAFYDHSGGFKDYDKLAMKKNKPDFLFYSLIDKVLLKTNTSTLECSSTSELDLKKLIEEYKEYLRLPENSPFEPKWDSSFSPQIEDDGWNFKELKNGIALRNAFKHLGTTDDSLEFLFQNLCCEPVFADREGRHSQVNEHFNDSFISILEGAAPINPENSNPYSNHPSLASYKSDLIGERESCVAAFSNHPGGKVLSSKSYADHEIREFKSGMPFESKGDRLPYHVPREVEEYTNHLIIRVAINRYLSNKDDSLAHLIFFKLFNAEPDNYYVQEAFRIINHSARSLSHKEIYTLARLANDYRWFDPSLHYLLALNHFRSKNFDAMEEEISNYCESMRYHESDKEFHPFPETSAADRGTYKENIDAIFTCVRKATIMNSCLYLMGQNYQRANNLLQGLQKMDFNELEAGGDVQHWIVALRSQIKIAQINPYAHSPRNFFSTKSEFFSLPTFNALDEMTSMIEHLKTRLDNVKEGETSIPENVRELNYQFLISQYLFLQFYTLSMKNDAGVEMKAIFDSIVSAPYYEGKSRKIERLAKTLLRSYQLSIGQSGIGSSLSLTHEPQLTRDVNEGYSVEQMIVETILNAYEMASLSNFKAALEIIRQLEIAHQNGTIGYYHITQAKACIEFDETFFTGGRINSQTKLMALYEACPIEALMREVPYQILYGEIQQGVIRKLYQLLGQASIIEVLPSVQIRCHMALAQVFTEMTKHKLAIDELRKAKKIAKSMKFPMFISMINRRFAIVYALMGDMVKACKKVDKCKVWQNGVKLSMLELGMVYFTKYFVHRKANAVSKDADGIQVLSCSALCEYLTKASSILQPYNIIFKWILVEELDYVLYAQSRTHSRYDVTSLQKHKKSLEHRFSKHLNLHYFVIDSSPEISSLSKEYKNKYSLPLHLI